MKPEEFNHIVLLLRRGLRDYLQRLTGNDDDAEDINTDYFIGIGIAPELRTNAWYKMKGADGNTTDTYKLNRMGLNAMLSWGIGPIVFCGSFGVTPLFNTTEGKKVYQNSFSVGVDVLSLVNMINYCKDKKKQRK